MHTQSMLEAKTEKYSPYMAELELQGIEYAPATLSAYGRCHPCVTQMLTQAAREAARRKGHGRHAAMLRRWYRSLACEIWRRASRMVLACMPREPRQTTFLLDGEVEDGEVHAAEDVDSIVQENNLESDFDD